MGRPADKNSDETRAFILKEAQKVFERRGFKSTSIREIQNETKISKGTIYYHFKNKEDLFLSCVLDSVKEEQLEWMKLSQGKSSALEKLNLWVDMGIREMKKPLTRSLYELAGQYSGDEKMDARVAKVIDEELSIITSILSYGISSGEFRKDLNVKDTAVILLNIFEFIGETSVFNYKEIQQQAKLCQYTFKLILEGIRHDSSTNHSISNPLI